MSKKNTKLLKKIKPKTLVKSLQLSEEINTRSKICVHAMRTRFEQLRKVLNTQDIKLKQAQDDLKQIQEVVLYYHKDLSEEHKGKEEVFRKVIEMPYCSGTNRLAVLQKEIEQTKLADTAKNKNLNPTAKPTMNGGGGKQNWSQLTISPIMSLNESSGLSDLLPKLKMPHILDRTTLQRSPTSKCSGSPNHSVCSLAELPELPGLPWRFHEWHKLSEGTVKNKVCWDCHSKEAAARQHGPHSARPRELHGCTACGIRLHEGCRFSQHRKMCIILPKLAGRAVGDRTLILGDLCGAAAVPMVPNVLLALMHHIHTFGLDKRDMYRSTGIGAEVRVLCEKLFNGKAKAMCEYTAETVGNCLRLILRSLKTPLLNDGVVLDMLRALRKDEAAIEGPLRDCIDEMSRENRDTFIYLMIHLKVIVEAPGCSLDTKGMAVVFMPSLTSVEMSTKHCKKLVELIDKLLLVDFEFYDDCLAENAILQCFFKGKIGYEAASNSMIYPN